MPSESVLSMVRGTVGALFLVWAKSIIASLDSSNGKLWLWDHSRPPPVCSIISLRMACASSSVSATATKAQLSTKPIDNLFLPLAMSIRSAL